jgi:hypothetical protein
MRFNSKTKDHTRGNIVKNKVNHISKRFPKRLVLTGLISLTGCGLLNTPPTVTLSGITAEEGVQAIKPVQISVVDDGTVSSVDLFVRLVGSTEPGIKVGSSSTPSGTATEGEEGSTTPFLIQWNTNTLPNITRLELYAVATDDSGLKGKSEVLIVNVINNSSPNMRYFASISIPLTQVNPASQESSTVSSSSIEPEHWIGRPLERIPLPEGILSIPARAKNTIYTSQKLFQSQVSSRNYVLEWAWDGNSGVRGYNIYLSKNGLLGTYTKLTGLSSSASNGLRQYRALIQPLATENYFGVVSTLTNAGETARSNTYGTVFYPAPALGTVGTLSEGKPTLNWTAPADPAILGYYFYVYKQNPLIVTDQTPIWTNSRGASTSKLTATFPPTQDKLAAGTYFWWVAGIAFNELGGTSGFSFSDPQSFEIPESNVQP